MSIEFIWQLPTGGDGRYGNGTRSRRGERVSSQPYFTEGVSDPRGTKFNYFDYLDQIARAAELAGFDGLQVRNDPEGDEPWIVAGYVARSTRRLRLLTEFDASRGSAVYAAKNAVSYQRYSGGRFAWQIGTGGTSAQRRRQGDFASDTAVGPRIEEFVTVARGVIQSPSFSFKGPYFEVLNGGFKGPLGGIPAPRVYLSGSDAESYERSARIADVHVFESLPLSELEAEIGKLRAINRERTNALELGLRIDVLARETQEEAQFDARRQREQTSDAALNGALVGSHEQVAGWLVDYARAGVSHFILGAVPHLEEAYRVGEHILPGVRATLASSSRNAA
jgi:alkanesulfonate monooxygenase